LGWYTFKSPQGFDVATADAAEALAGPVHIDAANKIVAATNCAWLLEQYLLTHKTPFRMFAPEIPAPLTVIPLLPECRVMPSGMDKPFPDYLLTYQMDAILKTGHLEGAHLWHSPGAGKTISAIIWSLLVPGPIVFVTRAAARGTIAQEIRRVTTCSPLVLIGETPCVIPKDTRFTVIGWEGLPHHIGSLLALHPTTVVWDESHKAKNWKRWIAVPERDAQTDQAVLDPETGRAKVTFIERKNISSAAEALARAAKRRLATTASPIKDRLRDLWAQLDLVEPRQWGRFHTWARRYCAASETQWGGLDTTGRAGETYMAELNARLSFSVHSVPYSVSHAALPPLRRLVTYLGSEALTAGREFKVENITDDPQKNLLISKLRMAADRKRKAAVELVIEAAAKDETGTTGGKVTVFTALRKDCEKFATALQKAAPGLKVWMAHGDHSTVVRDQIREEYMAHPGPCALVGTGNAWGECVRPDTFVLGENKAIIDYRKGDRVIGATGLNTVRGKKSRHFAGNMVEIAATGTLPIAATPNHPVFTLRGHKVRVGHGWRVELDATPRWRRIDSLTTWNPSPARPQDATGDFLLIPRVPGQFTDVVFDLDGYTKGDNARAGRRARRAPTKVALNASMAWLMGLYAAEGSAAPRGKDGHGMRAFFSLGSHERGLAERVVRALRVHGFPGTINPTATNGLNVTVRSGPLARLLADHMGMAAHNKKIPDEILFNTDLNVVRAFMQGWAMGDGSTDGNRVQTYTVSRTLAMQAQLMMARLGRLACITPWQAKPSMIRGREVRGGPGFHVVWRWENRRHQRYKVLEHFLAVPMTLRREVAYDGDVVDIETTDHTFLGSNVVIHNSINLQDTDVAFVVMLPWTPGDIRQWEGRFARHGQLRPVLIRYLIAEGTADEHVASLLIEKLPSVERIVKDEELMGFGHVIGGLEDEDAVIASLVARVAGAANADVDEEVSDV
jgi:hypothetical protein